MPMHSSYIAEEYRLDLSFSGNLDLSLEPHIHAVCMSTPPDLRSCIIDLYDIDRLFDSGVALLEMLQRHLAKQDVLVVILSNSRELRARMPPIPRRPSPFYSLMSRVPSRIAQSIEPGWKHPLAHVSGGRSSGPTQVLDR